MPSIPTIAITIGALSLFFYLSGYKGLIILAVLFTILLGLIYFKQNMLLYMPGNRLLKFSCSRLTEIFSIEPKRLSSSFIKKLGID